MGMVEDPPPLTSIPVADTNDTVFEGAEILPILLFHTYWKVLVLPGI
jgi:hypothetical protein